MLRRFSRLAGVCVLACAAGWLSTAGAQSLKTYNVSLSNAEVATDATGRSVVTFIARGDLPGTMTVAVQTDASGAVTGGEWALNVSYVTTTAADGTVTVGKVEEPGSDEAGAPREVEALVQKGMLTGSVASGAFTRGDDGAVTGISGLALTLTGGSLQFQQATNGSGTLTASNFPDRTASTGALTVIF